MHHEELIHFTVFVPFVVMLLLKMGSLNYLTKTSLTVIFHLLVMSFHQHLILKHFSKENCIAQQEAK